MSYTWNSTTDLLWEIFGSKTAKSVEISAQLLHKSWISEVIDCFSFSLHISHVVYIDDKAKYTIISDPYDTVPFHWMISHCQPYKPIKMSLFGV